MAGRVRGFETVGDMVRSLGAVGVFIAVILLITLRQTPDRIKVVDAAPIVDAVAQAAPFDASVPGPTPAGWNITSARVTLPTDVPYSWYVGYSTETEQFVAVSQIYAKDPATSIREIGADGDADGTVTIDGEVWNKFTKPDDSRRALIRTEGEVTTVVVGTAPYAVLEATAGALVPATKPTSGGPASASPSAGSPKATTRG